MRKRQNDHFPTIIFLRAKLTLPLKSKNNMSYGYVKNRIFAQNGIFGAEMAQKFLKTTLFGPI